MSPPTEAPIPMSLAEALVIGEGLQQDGTRHTDRERRALEQLVRHARQARRSSSSAVDLTGELLRQRDLHRQEAERLTAAIGSATTAPGPAER